MNYELREKAKELQGLISGYTVSHEKLISDDKAIIADLKWNASLFFAKVINLSQPPVHDCLIENFEKFKKTFEEKSASKVNTDGLFNRFWLRKVLGFVEIPGTVSSAVHSFDSFSGFKPELEFILGFFQSIPKGQKTVPKADLENEIAKYERKTGRTLKREGVYFRTWLSDKDGLIKFADIDYYFKPFLDHWEDFEFISSLKALLHNEKDGLKIDTAAFDRVHASFSLFYPETPSIPDFISDRLLRHEGNIYILDFWKSELRYWTGLMDRITGHYWEMLVKDDQYSSDADRITKFICQVSYFEGFPDVLKFTTPHSQRRFLDAAFDLIRNDQDLVGIDVEFKKLSADRRFSSAETQILFHGREDVTDFKLCNTDYFELLHSLNFQEKMAHDSYLHSQSSRRKLTYLIKMIVRHDYEDESITEVDNKPNRVHFNRTIGLLRLSLERPTLLWDISRFIIMCRREILPFLMADKDFVSMAFQTLNEFEYVPGEKVHLSKKLWTKCIEFSLFTIRSAVEHGQAAKIVFQIYRQLNIEKYTIPYSVPSETAERISRRHRSEKEESVLAVFEKSLLYNQPVHGGTEYHLLPRIFNDIADHFINYNEPIYMNGTIYFPMLQLDGMVWLMKCSAYWRYNDQFKTATPKMQALTLAFFKSYTDRIETSLTKKFNFTSNKVEDDIPLWSEKIERLEFIDWFYPVYFLYDQSKLNSFLEPRIVFDITQDKYDRANKFAASKLRTHLGVLLQVLRKLIIPAIPYGFEKKTVENIRFRVEQQIIEYISRNLKDLPEEGRIDLFDYNHEWAFKSSDKEALLPQVAKALNWFEQKEQIINAIVQSHDLIKILTIAEWVTSVGIKQKLIDKIQQSDVQAFLQNLHWIPEIQQLLLQISEYPDLINQIEEVAEFWKEKISNKKEEYAGQLFQTQMLLAYFRSDEAELESIQTPDDHGSQRNKDLTSRDHKSFYKALIKMARAPQDAHVIFDELSKKYPHFPVLALNKMAAKITMGKQNSDAKLFREAWEEWLEFSARYGELENESLKGLFYVNKIFVLLKLQEYGQLDETFRQLELPYQMSSDILSAKIESLVQRKKIEEALSILEDAEDYHRFSDSKDIQFVKDLKDSVMGIDNIDELKIHYSRIFESQPTKLIKIFPEKLNGRIDIFEFITKEVALAASKMLDKVHALPAILTLKNTSKENRFNDLIQLALESRISSWGWSVKDQTRKAFSVKDLGEIDLDIRNFNQESFITCEAFILRDFARVQSHLEKLISHYTHQRKYFLVLTYYQGSHADFETEWCTYYKTTLVSVKYPTGYELDSGEISDVTVEFGYDKSGIRIGKGLLKSGSTLFNVFVNINYKVV